MRAAEALPALEQLVMATQECGDLRFGGELAVTLDTALLPEYPDGFLVDARQAWLMRFGITRRQPQCLWIGPPKVCFAGKVTVGGTGHLSQWKAGLLQSISHATWSGYYTNNQELHFRLNTDAGLLKDGSDDSLFFRYPRDFEAGSSSICQVEINDSDSAQATFWREFSGDPRRPHEDAAGSLGRLARTQGQWHFQTFLAAVNHAARLVMTLAECHWSISWNGVYDYQAGAWHSEGNGEMIAHTEVDRAELYEIPSASPSPTPFSLLMDAARRSWQVQTATGWMPCRDCRPVADTADEPTSRKW
jgi:hypothetical protein